MREESLALVAHDMRTRQIEATVNLSPNPAITCSAVSASGE